MEYEIVYPTPLDSIEDKSNDNIDVFVNIKGGDSYTLVIATPENLKTLIKKENRGYLPPVPPMAIVEELTESNINLLVEDFVKGDCFWLKIYSMCSS